MDPPIINEASFSQANQAPYSLEELWPFQMAATGGELGGLGLRMGSFGSYGDAPAPSMQTSASDRDVSVDESTVTEQSGSRGGGSGGGGRKRNNVISEDESSKLLSTGRALGLKDLDVKRMKASGSRDENGGSKAEAESNSKMGNKPNDQSYKPEPAKDYIHVRARRGQATDSHSLAERARREKISERMKVLQDLVPGCNKVIGKALVLDEIINYVQSLQHQVEFLSMKLEAVNSRMNPSIEGFPPKDLQTLAFDATGMLLPSHPPTEYPRGTEPEWLHIQIGSSFDRAT